MPTYVEIERCSVEEIFDDQHKAGLIKIAEKAILAGIANKKDDLTREKPKSRDDRGYSLTVKLFMTLDAGAKKLKGKCEILVNGWPAKTLHRKVTSNSATEVDPAKVTKGDMEDVANHMMKDVVATAITYMVSTEP